MFFIVSPLWFLDPGNAEETGLKKGQVLSEDEYEEAIANFGNGSFKIGVGAESILSLLQEINVDELYVSLRQEFSEATSEAVRKKNS